MILMSFLLQLTLTCILHFWALSLIYNHNKDTTNFPTWGTLHKPGIVSVRPHNDLAHWVLALCAVCIFLYTSFRRVPCLLETWWLLLLPLCRKGNTRQDISCHQIQGKLHKCYKISERIFGRIKENQGKSRLERSRRNTELIMHLSPTYETNYYYSKKEKFLTIEVIYIYLIVV